jgi:hypothetical protein
MSSIGPSPGPGSPKYYIFLPGESFADVGKVELRGAGNELLESFTYNETAINIVTYGLATMTRNYSIGESEATAVGQSLTFCGLASGYSLQTSLSLQSMAATNGTIHPCITLPVTLQNFAYTTKEKNIHLSWETVTESNSGTFIIEKSVKGVEFTEAGIVPAAGNSNTLKQYKWTDNNPSYINHYRLKLVDRDGKFNYSKIIFVKMDPANPLQLLQNPVRSQLRIAINLDQAKLKTITLYDVYARSIRSASATEGVQSININELSPGKYYIQLVTKDGTVFYRQFMKL